MMTEAADDGWHEFEGDRFRPFGLRRTRPDQPIGAMVAFCREHFESGEWVVNQRGSEVVARFTHRNHRLHFRLRF